MKKEEVLKLISKKHVKIFLLKSIGLANKEIATLLETNSGHVYNSLKNYDEKSDLKSKAFEIIGVTRKPDVVESQTFSAYRQENDNK